MRHDSQFQTDPPSNDDRGDRPPQPPPSVLRLSHCECGRPASSEDAIAGIPLCGCCRDH